MQKKVTIIDSADNIHRMSPYVIETWVVAIFMILSEKNEDFSHVQEM